MKSSSKVTENTENSPARRERIHSLRVQNKGRRNTIHAFSGFLVQKRITPSVDYTSNAIKAYRERRALYHKSKQRSFKNDLEGIQQEKLKPLDRFRKTVRMVIILRQAFENIVYYASEKGKHDEITNETAMSLKATAAQGTVEDLMFNPEDYKSNFKNMFPTWAKHLTNKLPQERSDDEIRLLIRLLKQLKGFRRYSPDVQFSICRVLKYEIYNRRRVIIRKGHIAQRLYFIFNGSVCVTVDNDEDEHSSFSIQQSSNETSVLRRGDYFGELAFLKNFKRGATIVCLEKTELLSMDKEDFFLSGIDKSFTRDLERRVEFLCNHPIFATWPTDTLRSLAEISRIHEYHSDEVMVRDSNKSSWLFFIIKGECDIVRLLDLSACDSYIKYQNRRRESSPGYRVLPSRTINLAGYFSPDSPMFKPLLSEDREELEDDDAAIASSISEINIHRARDVAEVAPTQSRTKSACSRTTRCSEYKTSVRGFSIADSSHRRNTKKLEKPESPHSGEGNATGNEDVGVGVYMVVDKLKPGQFFGTWSIVVQEEGSRTKNPVDKRRLTLISRGCEVIKISKEGYQKLTNSESMETMKQLSKKYPCDDKLCRTYLKLSDWRSYREELVENLMEKRMKEHEMAMGLWRTQTTPASPVPSPLCSAKPWQPVNLKWEYFPGSGWVSSKVTHPVIQVTGIGMQALHDKKAKRCLSPRCSRGFTLL